MEPSDTAVSVFPNAETIGNYLRKTRLDRQLDQSFVSTHLRLSLSQIQALEKGDFSVFRNPVFIRGYLRSYAKLLAVDGGYLIRLYDATLPSEEIKFQSGQAESLSWHESGIFPLRRKVFFACFVLIIFFAVLVNANLSAILNFPLIINEQLHSRGFLKNEQPDAIATAVTEDPSLQAMTMVSPKKESTAAIDEPVPLPATSVERTSVSDGSVGTPDPNRQSLHLEFREDCWIQVKELHGEILHEKLHMKGDVLDMTVVTPVQLWFGKASAVSASFNGSPINIPLKTGFQSARFVLGDEISSEYE